MATMQSPSEALHGAGGGVVPTCDADRERAEKAGRVDRSVGKSGDPDRAAVVCVQLEPGNVADSNEEGAAKEGAARRPEEAGRVIHIGWDGVRSA